MFDAETLESALFSLRSHPGVGLHIALNGAAQFVPCIGKVVHLLKVQPELRVLREEGGRAQHGVWTKSNRRSFDCVWCKKRTKLRSG